MFVAILGVYIAVIVGEGIYWYNKKKYKEMIVFIILMVFNMVISILISFDVDVPNPNEIVYSIIKLFKK